MASQVRGSHDRAMESCAISRVACHRPLWHVLKPSPDFPTSHLVENYIPTFSFRPRSPLARQSSAPWVHGARGPWQSERRTVASLYNVEDMDSSQLLRPEAEAQNEVPQRVPQPGFLRVEEAIMYQADIHVAQVQRLNVQLLAYCGRSIKRPPPSTTA